MKIEDCPRLTAEEKHYAAQYKRGEWALLNIDELTGTHIFIRHENGRVRVLEKPNAEALAFMVEEAKRRKNEWTGWRDPKNKNGAIVQMVPTAIHSHIRNRSGFDGHTWDKKKYNAILEDEFSVFKVAN